MNHKKKTIQLIITNELKAHNQENGNFLAKIFTPNFFCIKWKILIRKIIPQNILQFLCVFFEIFQFGVSAITLYGNSTSICDF